MEKIKYTEQWNGHVIDIYEDLESETDRVEILKIDGETVPYSKTSEGFYIYYQSPEPDLTSAAKSYIDTQPEKIQ